MINKHHIALDLQYILCIAIKMMVGENRLSKLTFYGGKSWV
jgi:hypothetical protein